MCLKIKIVQAVQVDFVRMGVEKGTFVCSRLGHQKCQDRHWRALLSNTLAKQLMSRINCVITLEMIMKKLHKLRSQYRREVKEMKTSLKSGAGTYCVTIIYCDC